MSTCARAIVKVVLSRVQPCDEWSVPGPAQRRECARPTLEGAAGRTGKRPESAAVSDPTPQKSLRATREYRPPDAADQAWVLDADASHARRALQMGSTDRSACPGPGPGSVRRPFNHARLAGVQPKAGTKHATREAQVVPNQSKRTTLKRYPQPSAPAPAATPWFVPTKLRPPQFQAPDKSTSPAQSIPNNRYQCPFENPDPLPPPSARAVLVCGATPACSRSTPPPPRAPAGSSRPPPTAASPQRASRPLGLQQ